MNIIFRYSMMAIVVAGLSFAGCSQDSNNNAAITDDAASQQQMASDEQNQNTETQISMNDANDAMAATGLGKTSVIANVTIDTTSILFKKLILHYSGKSADSSRIRTGDVVIQLTGGSTWKDPLAAITILYKHYKVTRIASGTSVTFDGEITATNTTGGRAFVDPTVIHTVQTTVLGLNITFNDSNGSQQVTWNLSRKCTYTNLSGVLAVSLEGTGTAGGYSNLLAWGINRNDSVFFAQDSTPIVYNSVWSNKCPGLFISGIKKFKGISHGITETLGLDQSGNIVDPNSSNCPGYYKIEWKNAAGVSKNVIIPY